MAKRYPDRHFFISNIFVLPNSSGRFGVGPTINIPKYLTMSKNHQTNKENSQKDEERRDPLTGIRVYLLSNKTFLAFF